MPSTSALPPLAPDVRGPASATGLGIASIAASQAPELEEGEEMESPRVPVASLPNSRDGAGSMKRSGEDLEDGEYERGRAKRRRNDGYEPHTNGRTESSRSKSSRDRLRPPEHARTSRTSSSSPQSRNPSKARDESPAYTARTDSDVEGDADAEGEVEVEGEVYEAAVVISPPDEAATGPMPVYDRTSPGTIDGLDQSQVSRLGDKYRQLATELKRRGDRRLRDPEAAASMEEQERSIVEQTDALLLFTFCFVCLDRASGLRPDQPSRQGKDRIHAEQWKSLEGLIDYVKDRAHRRGFEVPWALCCLVEAVMSHKLASLERAQLLKLPSVAPHASSSTANKRPLANGVVTTGDKDSPESASTSTSSSDHNAAPSSSLSSSDVMQSFVNLANWETRAQRSFSDACGLLSTHFVRTYLPDTARLCADLESRTDEAPTWLPHSPWWFCWPLNPYDCASDVSGFGRAVLEEYAGERLGLEFPAVELFLE